MDLIGGYDSDTGSQPASPEGAAHQQEKAGKNLATAYSDSDDTSDDESVDSAKERALAAAARLKDYGQEDDGFTSQALPSALAAFGQVEGPPAFLDPEATRPLVRAAAHAVQANGSIPGDVTTQAAEKKPFDIASLAPPLKGQNAEKRGPGVIEGKAKRYKLDDGIEATQHYSAAQIAMFGGNVDNMRQQAQQQGSSAAAKAPTKPMPVDDFLSRGVGGAQLPRAQQDRKDKERKKRALGQSTHSHWKSEAEMVLRQQFD